MAAVRQAASAVSPPGISAAEAFGPAAAGSPLDLHETEKKLIMQALAAINGHVTAAAKKLDISRRTLHRRINEMNLAKAPPKPRTRAGPKSDHIQVLCFPEAKSCQVVRRDSSLQIAVVAAVSAAELRVRTRYSPVKLKG